MKDIDPDAKLWRYLSCDKFFDLVHTSELYFASPKEFSDSWECYPPAFLLHNENWREFILNNSAIKISNENIGRFIDNLTDNFEANYYENTDLLFSCWHCPNNRDKEHAGLWDLNADSKNGVAISTSFNKIMSAIDEPEHIHRYLTMGKIRYLDFEDKNINIREFFGDGLTTEVATVFRTNC